MGSGELSIGLEFYSDCTSAVEAAGFDSSISLSLIYSSFEMNEGSIWDAILG